MLGLVRPYDAALLAGIEGLAVLLTAPPREWPRRLLPVLALVPVLAYDGWLFLAGPGFSAFSSPRYAALAPAAGDLALALGPAALLALTAARLRRDEGARYRLRLGLWAGARSPRGRGAARVLLAAARRRASASRSSSSGRWASRGCRAACWRDPFRSWPRPPRS